MCDRYGAAILPKSEMLRSAVRPSHRSVLTATAASTLTFAIGPGLAGLAHAQAGRSLKSAYSIGNHIAPARCAPF